MGFEYLGLLFIVSLVLCLVGFYKYSYFMSVGYGFAVAGIGISLIMLCLMKQFRAETSHYIMFALLVILGIVVDPTTVGVGDSKRALGYEEPWKDQSEE
jgi:phi LC3 family holin